VPGLFLRVPPRSAFRHRDSVNTTHSTSNARSPSSAVGSAAGASAADSAGSASPEALDQGSRDLAGASSVHSRSPGSPSGSDSEDQASSCDESQATGDLGDLEWMEVSSTGLPAVGSSDGTAGAEITASATAYDRDYSGPGRSATAERSRGTGPFNGTICLCDWMWTREHYCTPFFHREMRWLGFLQQRECISEGQPCLFFFRGKMSGYQDHCLRCTRSF
jgi:hypothetical protein